MTTFVYLTSVSLQCYSESKDVIIKTKLIRSRGSLLKVFYEKGVLKNLAKLTGKRLCTFLLKVVYV